MERCLGREVSAIPIQATMSLGGSFSNSRNVLIPSKVRSDVLTKKTDAIKLLYPRFNEVGGI